MPYGGLMLSRGWFVRIGSAVAAAALGLGVSTGAAWGSVSRTPAKGTPQLARTGRTEQVRELAPCHGNMYAVGSFSSISWDGHTYSRHNVFSFRETAPYTVTSWNPDVNGKVNSVAFNNRCSVAYLGGKFTSVHGTGATNLVAVSTSSGAVVKSFGHYANGQVETLLKTHGHLLTGGYFTRINGSGSARYMTSLSTSTGRDDGFLRLNISGNYHYCLGSKCAGSNPTRVYNQQLSHSKSDELVEGDFTSVGGQPRQQVFMLSLTGSTGRVTPWTSSDFNQHCGFSEPFYLQAASWSPNDGTIYIATTGFHPYNWNGSFPLTGICDAAAAYPASQRAVSRDWINYTGCDSLYSTAADSATAYFGGHERWSENPRGCDHAGPGAISAPGMEGLSPSSGKLIFNPTRARGLGADDMLVTSAGLWIASDNFAGSNQCGGVSGHAGICFLPN
jgi:hypothetical protein